MLLGILPVAEIFFDAFPVGIFVDDDKSEAGMGGWVEFGERGHGVACSTIVVQKTALKAD